MVAKDFLNYVLRDDATVHGGVSFHGQTLGDFIAETDLTEDSDMNTVNFALIECGIMPVPFDGMVDAFSVEGLDCFSDEPTVLYYMSMEAAVMMAGVLVEWGSEVTVTDMVNGRVVYEGGKEKN